MWRLALLLVACAPADSTTTSACPDAVAPDPSAPPDLSAPPDSSAPPDLGGQPCQAGTVVSYLKMTSSDTSDTRCDAGATGSCQIDLRGFLYVPSGSSLPAIVYNHGSEQLAGPKCTIADYFVPRGYVVFVPHRRGHGRSTGVYLTDYTAQSQIAYLQMQVQDVTDAFNYVKALPQVDPKRIAIMGHSYGGIMTLLTNQSALGQPAALDLCGDSESWNNSAFRTALMSAVDNAKAPLFFAQPANDVHVDPTVEFAHRAGVGRQQYQSAIYPPVPNVATTQEAHGKFVSDATQVAIWGPGALDFLHRYGM